MDERYKPVVPDWVGEVLQKKKSGHRFYKTGNTKRFDEWRDSYSRKYKYAMMNGWITESEYNKWPEVF